jgi:hypothetical protein
MMMMMMMMIIIIIIISGFPGKFCEDNMRVRNKLIFGLLKLAVHFY